MPQKCETQPGQAGLAHSSLLDSLDNRENAKNSSPVQDISRDPAAVREARLELIREAIYENLSGCRLFIETAQLLIEARDDAGMAHAISMGGHHYRAAVVTAKELAGLKASGGAR